MLNQPEEFYGSLATLMMSISGRFPLRGSYEVTKHGVHRLIKRIDPSFAQGYIRRFGFEASRNPPYFTLALGAGAVTPLQLEV